MTETSPVIVTPSTALAKAQASVFDPSIFQQLIAISSQMAHTSLIPETLTKDKAGVFPIEKIQANCFLVAEQAHRWGMSPFAVAQCASVVYGRLMWEGKLVAAVIEQNAGIRLSYEYEGEGENRKVTVSGQFPNEERPRTVTGTVKGWKTDQWKGVDYDQRLAYRGAREWGRRHCPGVMLGVVTEDEAEDYEMRDATPRPQSSREKVNPFPEKTVGKIAEAPAPPPVQTAPQVKEQPPQQEAPAPPTDQSPTAKATAATAAFVKSADQSGDEWLIVLKGAEREMAVVAENSEIGQRAKKLVDCPAWVVVKARGGKFVLTSIKLKEEEGDLV